MLELCASFEQVALEMVADLVEQDHQVRPVTLTVLGDLIHEHGVIKDQTFARRVHVSQCIRDWGRTINKIGVKADMLKNIGQQGVHVIFMAIGHWPEIFQKLGRDINMLIFQILMIYILR